MPKPTEVKGLRRGLPATRAARQLLAARLRDVVRYVEPLLAGSRTADDVHDMRVALRRLRAGLRLFEQRELDRQACLPELQRTLGVLRDLDVQLLWLEAIPTSDPARPAAERLAAGRRRAVPPAVLRLERELRRFEAGAAALAAALTAVEVPGKYGGGRQRAPLRRRLARYRRAAKRVAKGLEPEAAHGLRIQGKRLRYQLELLAPALPELAERLLPGLTEVQGLLGDLHDADVRLEWLDSARLPSALSRSRRALRARVAGDRSHLEGELREALDQLRKTLKTTQVDA